jgi:hypothetical protein
VDDYFENKSALFSPQSQSSMKHSTLLSVPRHLHKLIAIKKSGTIDRDKGSSADRMGYVASVFIK